MRPSWFVYTAGLVTASALAVIGCSKPSGLQEAQTVLPADTSAWVDVDVAKFLQSELGKTWAANPKYKKKLDDYKTACGFDPLKQIHHISLAAPADAENPQASVLVLVQGEFDEATIKKCVNFVLQKDQKQLTESTMGTHRIYEVTGAGTTKRLAFAMPTGKNWLVASMRGPLERALTVYDKKAPAAKDNKAFTEALQRAETPNGVLTGFVLLDAAKAQQINTLFRNKMGAHAPGVDLSKLKDVMASLVLKNDGNVFFRAVANVGDKMQAQNVARLGNYGLDKLRTNPYEILKQFSDALADVKIFDTNDSVTLEVPVAKEKMATFLAMFSL